MQQQPKYNTSKDTASSRKKRLQQRLQEISDKSEQELNALMKSLDKVKANFKNEKSQS